MGLWGAPHTRAAGLAAAAHVLHVLAIDPMRRHGARQERGPRVDALILAEAAAGRQDWLAISRLG
jgi:hypothetical protein